MSEDLAAPRHAPRPDEELEPDLDATTPPAAPGPVLRAGHVSLAGDVVPACDEGTGTPDAGRARWRLGPGVSLEVPLDRDAEGGVLRLARRPDGTEVRLSLLLHAVATEIDPHRTSREIADAVTAATGRTLSERALAHVIEHELEPLGLVEQVGTRAPSGAPTSSHPTPTHPDDATEHVPSGKADDPDDEDGQPDALPLHERYVVRLTVVPAPIVERLSGYLAPLLHPLTVATGITAFLVVDWQVLGSANVVDAFGEVLASSSALLALAALTVVAAIVHELGHAAACRYSGGTPGRIGVGIHLPFPALFTDIEAYDHLPPAGRVRTALGGIYFALLVIVGAGTLAQVTGSSLLVLLVVVLHVELVRQLAPAARLDGHRILIELTGMPDLFHRLGPLIGSSLSDPDERPLEPLPRRPRLVLTAWVLLLVPLVGYGLWWLVRSASAITATAASVVGAESGLSRAAQVAGDTPGLAALGISLALALIVIALAGLALVILRLLGILGGVVRRILVRRTRRSEMTTPASPDRPEPDHDRTAAARPTPSDARPPTATAPAPFVAPAPGNGNGHDALGGGSGSPPARGSDPAPERPDRPVRPRRVHVDQEPTQPTFPEDHREVPASPAAAAEASDPASGAPPAGEHHALSADQFTDEALVGPTRPVARTGWRRHLTVATRGRIALPPGEDEQRRIDLVERVRAPIRGTRRVVVMSRKGGVGKTTMTVGIGATFATLRGDRVVAVDANPDAGNLAYRIAGGCPRSITDLVQDIRDVRSFSRMREYTSQCPYSRLEVLASDNDPRISQGLDRGAYGQVVSLLDHFYNLVLLDTGTGILDSANQGLLTQTDQIVLVIRPALDGARAGAQTLDWLDEHGYADLVESAVVVINGVGREADPVVPFAQRHFAERCSHVATVPWDATLEAGGRTTLEALAPQTREAFEEIAAALADRFAGHPRTRTDAPSQMSPLPQGG